MLTPGKLYQLYSPEYHLCIGKTCEEQSCNGQGLWDFIICADELGGKEYLTTIYNESIGMYIDKIECNIPILFEDPLITQNENESVYYYKFLIQDRIIYIREDSFKYEPVLCTAIL